MSSQLNCVVNNPKSGQQHTATIIFMHGLGDTGHGWAQTINVIKPPFAKSICPTAYVYRVFEIPVVPVTLNAGFEMPSWFDLRTLDATGPEDSEGIKKACQWIHSLIEEEETKHGIPSNRIVVGGFSQGGGLAVHSALRYPRPLAGVVAFSCWLPLHKEYPGALSEANKDIPIFQCHGDSDPVVPLRWGQMSAELLSRMTSKHQLKVYKGMSHSSSEEELRDAKDFLVKILPALLIN
ncbi:Acyl-protein thioesterase 1-like protein [Leptotrombidium deliense]|uniref:palmitoyl-protein hydrolase n=1 Tax=Leptotrombidium deliense TaxID=299467 RepID=A0A443S973_9ACAR|nr:Acyl-protein thioesterase 1-like protein [Leptotrombidium deliense]